jgi:hypothetical protein
MHLKTLTLAALALNAALYVAAGILFSSVVPLSFGPVRFWPQAVLPAIFAVIFGPWVGGIGAAIGIFANDLILNGNPLLSLMAGVTANFACYGLIGYISQKKIKWTTSIVSYGAITAALLLIVYLYSNIIDMIYAGVIIASFGIFVAIALVAKKYLPPKTQSYQIGSVIGLLVGSAIIGLMVPVYFQYLAPNSTQITLGSGMAYLIWTFATEIPFLLVIGPPVVAVIFKAFPNLRRKEERQETI